MEEGVIKYTSPRPQFTTLSFFIMSKSIALSLLAQGNNGEQILEILNSIAADNVSEVADSSEEELVF